MEGKYVIVRADQAGVFAGTLKKQVDSTTVIMSNVRKLHYWDGAAAVEEIAVIGTKKPEGCRFTVVVEEMQISGVCQIIPATETAIENIKKVTEWKA